jgi:predicted DNA-binding protein
MKAVFVVGVSFRARPRMLKRLDELAEASGRTRREELQTMIDDYLDLGEDLWIAEEGGSQEASASRAQEPGRVMWSR